MSELTTDRAMFTEAYAVLPKRTMTDIVTSYLPFWDDTRLWVLARPLSGFAETFSQYLVEVFPVAHIFRPGHALLVKLMAPPAVDSQYSYAPSPQSLPVTLNTLFFGPAALSRITLPVVDPPSTVDANGPACGDYNSVRCETE